MIISLSSIAVAFYFKKYEGYLILVLILTYIASFSASVGARRMGSDIGNISQKAEKQGNVCFYCIIMACQFPAYPGFSLYP